jgi:hypothetical protein
VRLRLVKKFGILDRAAATKVLELLQELFSR